MTDDEIRRLAHDLESDRVERKESFSGVKDKIAQAICAFANDLPDHREPGVILIGLDDKGTPKGLNVTDELLLTVAALRDDGQILPLPVMEVRKVDLEGRSIVALLVRPSLDTPVRLGGRIWIRVGPRRAVASRDEERILIEKRQARDLPFDRRALFGASLSDLDLEYFLANYLPRAVSPEVFEQNGRTNVEQLQALRLLSPEDVPNPAALLLLGRDPMNWLPGAYIQFVRFDGLDMDAPILDQKELSGRVAEMLTLADTLARVNIRVATQIEGQSTERRHPDYPIIALEQLIRNAVLHRSYENNSPIYVYWFSDRVEIHSPGGLYGRVTPDNFGQAGVTDYRNRTLAEGLKVLGYVQRFGWGIYTARKRCAENGNPDPEFNFSSAAFAATVRRRP